MSHKPLNRRRFLTNTAALGAVTIVPRHVLGGAGDAAPSAKLNLAGIGVGGMGASNLRQLESENIVALCDVDHQYAAGTFQRYPQAKTYVDYREMLDKQADIDAVMIATPDHTHAIISMEAMRRGKHVYCQKPLTHNVYEARMLAQAAEQYGVTTQMGNQGHAGDGWRRAYEYVKAGAVGDIKEFHTWTNRPIWPQGGDRPKGSDDIPASLDWDAWIGPAAMRPFKKGVYHPFAWRGFVDFGSGALGDMACHTTDGIYSIMEPGYAATAEPFIMTGPVTDMWPAGMIIKSTYRAKNGRPGFKTFWYEGKDGVGRPFMPDTPDELLADGRELPRTGNLIIGTKGKMLVIGDYWETPMLIPEAKRKAFGRPKQLLERSPGHHKEFFMACRGEKPREFSRSNFGYSGPMAANIQLGNLCARAGKKLELNEGGEITSDPKINDLAWREPRDGWGPLEMKV